MYLLQDFEGAEGVPFFSPPQWSHSPYIPEVQNRATQYLWVPRDAAPIESSSSGSLCRSRTTSGSSSGSSSCEDIWEVKESSKSSRWLPMSVNVIPNIWSPFSYDDDILDASASSLSNVHPHVDESLVEDVNAWGPYTWWEALPTPQEAEEMQQRKLQEIAEAKLKAAFNKKLKRQEHICRLKERKRIFQERQRKLQERQQKFQGRRREFHYVRQNN